jgi:hypothetical protein
MGSSFLRGWYAPKNTMMKFSTRVWVAYLLVVFVYWCTSMGLEELRYVRKQR